MTELYTDFLVAAETAARTAGAVINEAFHKTKTMTIKGEDTDLVTETDKAAEEIVMNYLKELFPTHKFIGEESVAAGLLKEVLDSDEPTWMIDPIDGTTNFVHKFPFCCVSIGLAIKKQVVVGVVYNPIMEEMFTAVKGGGAKLNGKPIHCNNSEDLKHCLIGTGFPYDRSDETLDWVLGNVKVILKNCRAVRRAGSAALDMCYVAKGSLDIYYERGVHAWDIAAGTIICQEAGAVVLDPYGEHDSIDVCGGRVICGNPVVVPKLAALIKPPPAKGNH